MPHLSLVTCRLTAYKNFMPTLLTHGGPVIWLIMLAAAIAPMEIRMHETAKPCESF